MIVNSVTTIPEEMMKVKKLPIILFASILILGLSLASFSNATAAAALVEDSTPRQCEEIAGGTWVVLDEIDGLAHADCIIPPGAPLFVTVCIEGGSDTTRVGSSAHLAALRPLSVAMAEYTALVYHFTGIWDGVWNWHLDSHECIAGGGGTRGSNPGGPYGNTGAANATTCLRGGLNGCVTFGNCAELYHCAISLNLPTGARSSLPKGTVATLYIRVREDKDEPACEQTVCFNTEGMAKPIVYQYKAGIWVPIASGGHNGTLCINHSGDGSFALVEGG